MVRFIIGSVILMLSACSTPEFSGPPLLGLKFNEPYPAMFGGGVHIGLDMDVPLRTPVRSIADGEVLASTTIDIRGFPTNVVSIIHSDGVISRYLHIDTLSVKAFDKVRQGQQIALTALNGPGGPSSTSSGHKLVPYPHLHLEVFKGGKLIDPTSLPLACGETKWRWPVGCKQPK